LLLNKNTSKSRRFGFIHFEDEETVKKVLEHQFHNLNGNMVEVKIKTDKDESSVNFKNKKNNNLVMKTSSEEKNKDFENSEKLEKLERTTRDISSENDKSSDVCKDSKYKSVGNKQLLPRRKLITQSSEQPKENSYKNESFTNLDLSESAESSKKAKSIYSESYIKKKSKSNENCCICHCTCKKNNQAYQERNDMRCNKNYIQNNKNFFYENQYSNGHYQDENNYNQFDSNPQPCYENSYDNHYYESYTDPCYNNEYYDYENTNEYDYYSRQYNHNPHLQYNGHSQYLNYNNENYFAYNSKNDYYYDKSTVNPRYNYGYYNYSN